MRWRIRRCSNCGRYTLKEVCPDCRGETRIAHPPKFSPEDPYGEYRRRLRRELLGIKSGR